MKIPPSLPLPESSSYGVGSRRSEPTSPGKTTPTRALLKGGLRHPCNPCNGTGSAQLEHGRIQNRDICTEDRTPVVIVRASNASRPAPTWLTSGQESVDLSHPETLGAAYLALAVQIQQYGLRPCINLDLEHCGPEYVAMAEERLIKLRCILSRRLQFWWRIEPNCLDWQMES